MIKLPAATSSSRYGVETEVAGNIGAEMVKYNSFLHLIMYRHTWKKILYYSEKKMNWA
jgi:hypothetical protein